MSRIRTIGEIWPNGGSVVTPPSENPFQRDEAGNFKSVTAIAAAIRANPQRAAELCRAAGEKVDAWMPKNPQ